MVPPPGSVVWPAAASPLTAGLLAAPPRPARVLAAFPAAVYLGLDAHADVLPVVAADALLLPTSLRLPQHSGQVRWGVSVGDQVTVGAGRVVLPGATIAVARQWRPVPVGAAPLPVRAWAWRAAEAGGHSAALRRLAHAAAAHALHGDPAALDTAGLDTAGLDTAVRALVGAGPGLTPSGDDALAGVLLALRAADRPGPLDVLAGAVTRAATRTTSLSASLLAAAGQGYAALAAVRLVTAMADGDDAAVTAALPALLSIGHTSGRDLLAGVLATVEALSTRRWAAAPPGTRQGARCG